MGETGDLFKKIRDTKGTFQAKMAKIKSDTVSFFSVQCKEIEEKNRMGKTRDLFKKIRDTKGTFHARWA